jgi:hypothetical protein
MPLWPGKCVNTFLMVLCFCLTALRYLRVNNSAMSAFVVYPSIKSTPETGGRQAKTEALEWIDISAKLYWSGLSSHDARESEALPWVRTKTGHCGQRLDAMGQRVPISLLSSSGVRDGAISRRAMAVSSAASLRARQGSVAVTMPCMARRAVAFTAARNRQWRMRQRGPYRRHVGEASCARRSPR